MDSRLTVRFFEGKPLDDVSIRSVQGSVGLYFIYLVDRYIEYPFQRSRLIYIGMSESKQNSIGRRLRDHVSGQSGNEGLKNYIRTMGGLFTHLTFDLLSVLPISTIPGLEAAFLHEFLKSYGSHPVCNNQSGVDLGGQEVRPEFKVEWQTFE